jgi:hypothetical protein
MTAPLLSFLVSFLEAGVLVVVLVAVVVVVVLVVVLVLLQLLVLVHSNPWFGIHYYYLRPHHHHRRRRFAGPHPIYGRKRIGIGIVFLCPRHNWKPFVPDGSGSKSGDNKNKMRMDPPLGRGWIIPMIVSRISIPHGPNTFWILIVVVVKKK